MPTALIATFNTTEIETLGQNLTKINLASIGASAVRGTNRAAELVFSEARKRMLLGVNLTDAYVKSRMDIEPAQDESKPVAVIVAFRKGGRRADTKPVNLRQYGVVQLRDVNNWSNSGIATNSGVQIADPSRAVAGRRAAIAMNSPDNPRKGGGRLPFIKRVGAPKLGIPVGQKQAGLSVEVTRGSRQTLPFAFLQTMRNGETLAMARVKGSPKKGKIKALYSLSVWQLFRKATSELLPFAQVQLAREVSDEVLIDIEKTL